MINRNDAKNPWTADDEKEHYPSVMEWWCAEAFFKTMEDDKKWSLKVAFTEWFENSETIGSIANMTVFDEEKNKHFIYYSRNDSVKLNVKKGTFDVRYTDSGNSVMCLDSRVLSQLFEHIPSLCE